MCIRDRVDCRVRVRGGRVDRHLRDYRQNIGSESKGRQVDHHFREYGRTGGSPSQRVLADGRIAIPESTGGLADHHLRERTGISPAERFWADGRIAISEITGRNPGSEQTGGQVDCRPRE